MRVAQQSSDSARTTAERSATRPTLISVGSRATLLLSLSIHRRPRCGVRTGRPESYPRIVHEGTFVMSRHILVVDDDDAIREVAELTLQVTAGWRVSTAASGAEALEVVRTTSPEVILMDVMMPVMDGLSTVSQLRADPVTAEIPVIMMTAKNLSADTRPDARPGRGDPQTVRPDDPGRSGVHDSGLDVVSPGDPVPDRGNAGLTQRLAEIAAQAGQTNRRRVEDLGDAVDRWASLDTDERTAAIGLAHALAGSAGTFGYAGVSVTARDLEACLAAGQPDRASGLITRLRDGLAAEPEPEV